MSSSRRGAEADPARAGGGRRPSARARTSRPGEEVVLPARTILVAAGTQPNTVLAREDPDACRARRPLFPRPRRGRRARRRRSASPSPTTVQVLMSLARGRPRGQLLRRSASELCRQCRQGDGRRQAGLSGGQPHAGDAARPPRPRRGIAQGAARRRVARPGARGRAADAEDRRGRRQGADGGARLPARPVLPAAELRDATRRGSTARPWRWKGSR